jgi:hypothetical protein
MVSQYPVHGAYVSTPQSIEQLLRKPRWIRYVDATLGIELYNIVHDMYLHQGTIAYREHMATSPAAAACQMTDFGSIGHVQALGYVQPLSYVCHMTHLTRFFAKTKFSV